MSIASNLDEIRKAIEAYECTLVAVSKTKPVELILEAIESNQLDFGENRVQELKEKAEELQDQTIRWHQIGHLQTNKVKYIAPFVHLVHAVDSQKLLAEINKQATKHNRTIDCLLEIHIAQESSKFGFDYEDLDQLLETFDAAAYPNVRLTGLMGMATFTSDQGQVAKEFKGLSKKYESIKALEDQRFPFQHLSMGMSGDYTIALDQGSNMIRVGSAIFGGR